MSNLKYRDIIGHRRPKVTPMIRDTTPKKTIRRAVMALITSLLGVTSMTLPSAAQAQAVSPTTTAVMVILTAKAGVERQQIMAVMPAEIRETVQLYLDGKIREWYSRGDGRGAVFLLDSKDLAEAESIVEDLPLAKQNLVDHEYIAIGPLLPLRLLVANP
jgi:ABC-type uncharacterized transport system permease subunit